MAITPPRIRGTREVPVQIVMDDFSDGVVTLLDEARLSPKMAREATNLMHDQDGLWTKRWGTQEYGSDISTSFDGWATATVDDGDGTASQELLVVDGGIFKKSTDGGSWSTIAGGVSFTAGNRARTAQLGSKVYFGNATDAIAFYDIDGNTMQSYSGISAPAAPTVARTTLTTGSYNNFYRVSAVNDVGETIATASSAGDAASGASYTSNKPRDNWELDGSEYMTISWSSVAGASGYNVYWSDTEGYEVLLGTTDTTEFIDDGSNVPNAFIEYPIDDTTTGPKIGYFAVSGNRIWGTLDPDNPYRVYFTGTGNQLGSYSPYFGGGYVDIELGGAERPKSIRHFRDGKGNPMAVVFTSDPNGRGSTWLIELISASVGSTSIVIPSTLKVQGSNGTSAPDSVIEARNALYGYNSAIGFNWLGTKPSQLNVLANDEVSVPIRNYVRNLSEASIDKMAGIEYDGKLIWSVPNGGTENNETIVYDLEQRAWGKSWTVGYKGFIEYTDTDGSSKLLAIPTSGTKFLELNENFLSDNGTAFGTKYRSGLIHFGNSHTEFAWVNKVHVILGRPRGTVNFSIIGTQRNKSSQTLKSKEITTSSSNSGIGTESISELPLISESTNAPDVFSEASIKKTIKVNKLLNNMVVEVSSDSAAADYTIMRIIVEGRLVPINEPSSWRN